MKNALTTMAGLTAIVSMGAASPSAAFRCARLLFRPFLSAPSSPGGLAGRARPLTCLSQALAPGSALSFMARAPGSMPLARQLSRTCPPQTPTMPNQPPLSPPNRRPPFPAPDRPQLDDDQVRAGHHLRLPDRVGRHARPALAPHVCHKRHLWPDRGRWRRAGRRRPAAGHALAGAGRRGRAHVGDQHRRRVHDHAAHAGHVQEGHRPARVQPPLRHPRRRDAVGLRGRQVLG
jgi:hypothetical protein